MVERDLERGVSGQMVPLGEVTRWLSGGTPNRSVSKYWEGEIPWISAYTLKKSEISESDQHLSPEGVVAGSKMAPVGSTLFLVRGSALYNEIRAGLVVKPVCFNQDVKALIPNPNVSPKFLTYSLLGRSADLLKLVSTASNSTGVLDTKLVKAFEILLPPLPEQRAIAAALSDADGLIGALDALIEKKRAIKQAAMQQLLTGKKRLPGFSEDPTGDDRTNAIPAVIDEVAPGYKRTEVGVIPRDWDGVPLGDLFTFKNGLNKAKHFFGFGTPIVNYMDVYTLSGIRMADLKGRVSLNSQEIANFEVRKGDVFFTRTSETVDEIGVAAVMLEDSPDTVFSGFVLRARPKNDRLDDAYKQYCFTPYEIRYQIVSKSTYTTRALTNGRLLSAVHIVVPPLPEQRAIAGVLSDLDAEITALERRRDKAKQIKQAMMQKLPAGRPRLIDPPEVPA